MTGARDAAVTSRRGVLAASGAALLGGAAVLGTAGKARVASPDAELIALCEEHAALSRLYHARHDPKQPLFYIKDDNERSAANEPGHEAQTALVERIYDIRATTMEGHMARAKLFIAYNFGDYEENLCSNGDDFAVLAALVRDLAGEAV